MGKRLLVLLLGLMVLAGCWMQSWAQDCDDYDPDQTKEEISLGRQASHQFEEHAHVETSGAAQARCQRIMNKMIPVTGRKLPFRVRVVDTPDVNAITFPGGFIYVFRGLLDQRPDDNMLANILGHELTHAVRAHSYRTMIVMQGLGHLSGGNAVSELGQIITVMGVGRHYENEADRLGMHFAAQAGFDPHGMLAAMQMLQRVSQSNPGLVGHLLATHPPIPERIAHIKAELKTMGK